MKDLAARLANRVQLTSDGFRPYYHDPAVEDAFGGDVEYAMLVKMYQNNSRSAYSPDDLVDPSEREPEASSDFHVPHRTPKPHDSHAARTVLPFDDFHSKKLENLKAALALHFCWYNFCRVYSSLRVTPAMAAGLTCQVWDLQDLIKGWAGEHGRAA
jgi:hypothetical protein